MPKMKKLCKRVYWYRHKWRFRPAQHHRSALLKLGRPTSWVPLSDNDREAMRALTHLLDLIDKNSDLMTGMKRVLDRYEQQLVPTMALATRKGKLAHLVRLRRSFGHMEPDQITTPMVQEYLDRRGRTSPSQANQEISTLSQCLRHAKVWGLMSGVNPVSGIIRHNIKARERIPSITELEIFKRHASPFIAAYTDLKLETSLRQSDLLNLSINQHLCEDGIRIKTSKTGKRLFFPWTERLKDSVSRLMGCNKQQGDFLICNTSGERLSKNTFSGRWKTSMKKALEAKESPLTEIFCEHDIRATHATLVEEKMGIEAASLNLGHDNLKTTKSYLRSRKYEQTTPFSEAMAEA